MSFWSRGKADEDPRDIRIRELAAALGRQRAATAQAQAERDAANRELANTQQRHHDDMRGNARIIAGLKDGHFKTVNTIEAERDRALARLTEVGNANIDALLDELGAVKAALKKAEEDKEVLAADKADLRAQLMRADADHAELSGQLATAEERLASYEKAAA